MKRLRSFLRPALYFTALGGICYRLPTASAGEFPLLLIGAGIFAVAIIGLL